MQGKWSILGPKNDMCWQRWIRCDFRFSAMDQDVNENNFNGFLEKSQVLSKWTFLNTKMTHRQNLHNDFTQWKGWRCYLEALLLGGSAFTWSVSLFMLLLSVSYSSRKCSEYNSIILIYFKVNIKGNLNMAEERKHDDGSDE